LRNGVDDNPVDHWRDMAGFNGDLDTRDNPTLRRILADAMPETFQWLLDKGAVFRPDAGAAAHQATHAQNVAELALLHRASWPCRA
jgi:fumarate reductase flavoprotein subunit